MKRYPRYHDFEMKQLAYWIPALLLCSVTVYVYAGDVEREQRLKEQALATLFSGEPLTLNANGTDFLTLETEAEFDSSKGAVILLHGRGLDPNSEHVVGPLRETLAENGWHTLSIQLPVLEKGKKYYDYVEIFPEALPRIDTAVNYLRSSHKKIVLLAHSCGVHMSMAWMREHLGDHDNSGINAYIGVAMGATDYKQPMREPFPLAEIKIPILDIFGSADYPAVINNAEKRWEEISFAGNKYSKQEKIADADHNFSGYEDVLFEAISEWLNQLP